MEVSGQLHATDALTQANSPRFALNRGMAGLQCWSGGFGEEKNILSLSGIESRYLGLRSRILITITTETPGNLWVCNTNRKIKKCIPSLGKIFVLYNGRAQFVASANWFMFSVKLAVFYLKG
jgi:hypothetical protein